MIPRKALLDVRTIVTHAGCPDGVAAAAVLKQALPDAHVMFVQYNTDEHRYLTAEPGMLFCDITPHESRLDAFVAAGAIVLDHHVSSQYIVERFGELGVYSEAQGVSGAVLALLQVYPMLPDDADAGGILTRIVTRVGIRDTWQTDDPAWLEACRTCAALTFYPAEQWLEAKPADWESMLSVGAVILDRQREQDERTRREAWWFDSRVGRVCAFQGDSRAASDIAERLRGDADVVVAFSAVCVDGIQHYRLSLRSCGEVDVSEIAARYGGGGHRHAAGCTVGAYTASPWDAVMDVCNW